ncbi:MAG TPA: tripartite tricarboxylate transporter permease [Candidatus Methylomirabilis sp.]|nr:tripartite tricarboxylate transporter permease [Candidatus Methylomirabilis sp.]
MWDQMLAGLVVNLQPSVLLVVAIGTVVGTIIGALPGLSAVSGVALMLPFTFTMEPARGLIMLAAVYMSAEYGGSISAILINTPGTSGAACTLLDGTPLTKKGQAQEALYTSLLAGTVGGAFGGIVLLFFTPILADLSLFLGPAEIFWVAVAGLSLVASLSGKHIVKGLVGVILGVALTTVGQDAISGDMRFTFEVYQLVAGIPLVPALLGLFAVASILNLLENPDQSIAPLILRKGALRFACEKLMGMKLLLLWSSILGTVVGIIPGAGASISAFVAYGEAKRISKHPEEFGHGSYEGVAAPECANNAVVGGAMVPLLALGIPGSGSAAVMYGALTVHGILAGPRLFTERADVAYTFMVGLMSTVVAMLIFGLVTIRWSSLMVHVPARFMVSGVLALSAIGTYGLRNSLFDVYVLIALGVLGYLFSKLDIPLVTIALGLVLGNLTEQSYQQAMMVGVVDAGSGWLYFLKRPIAVILMLAALAVLISGILQNIKESSSALPAPSQSGLAPGERRRISLRAANIVIGLLLVALALFGLVEAQGFSERGAMLPRLLCGVLMLLGTILAVASLRPRTGVAQARAFPFAGVPWPLWWGAVAAFTLFGLAADRFGFYESAFVFLVVTTWMMSSGVADPRRRWLVPILYAGGFDAALYLVFRLILDIPTPPGPLL